MSFLKPMPDCIVARSRLAIREIWGQGARGTRLAYVSTTAGTATPCCARCDARAVHRRARICPSFSFNQFVGGRKGSARPGLCGPSWWGEALRGGLAGCPFGA